MVRGVAQSELLSRVPHRPETFAQTCTDTDGTREFRSCIKMTPAILPVTLKCRRVTQSAQSCPIVSGKHDRGSAASQIWPRVSLSPENRVCMVATPGFGTENDFSSSPLIEEVTACMKRIALTNVAVLCSLIATDVTRRCPTRDACKDFKVQLC